MQSRYISHLERSNQANTGGPSPKRPFFELFRIVKIQITFLSVLIHFFGCKPETPKIEYFLLDQVRLSAGPFLEAQLTDLNYMLEMDPDRLLAPFLEDAGLPVKKPHYENWEGSGLNGHIGGHYLSALSLMYASTGNDSLRRRLEYMLDVLKQCQQANGNGYVGGIPDGRRIWNEIKSGKINSDYFSLNGGWVPLYNIHKLFAGLRDAYLIAHQENARTLWLGLSDWMVATLDSLTDEQVQSMLKSEHGGLNEVFADLYAVTGDERYLKTAIRLSHKKLLDPLLESKDELTGMHANTQIPKVVGFERIAEVGGPLEWTKASEFFWQTVVQNRSVSIGGNSVREHFHPSDNFSAMLSSEQGPETCNTYNMLRLSKLLFSRTGDSKYLDYYERGLYNHILSSQHPNGGFIYFTPVRPNHYRVYSKPEQDMWCCVGSGIENHGKYGELIYAHKGDGLLVNLLIPSVLDWKERGIRITQKTKFPFESQSELTVELERSEKFPILIRIPEWSKATDISLNDDPLAGNAEGGFVEINRRWNSGDVVAIKFSMEMEFEQLPDGSGWGSFVYGPIVLAAATDRTEMTGLWSDGSRMGHVPGGRFYSSLESPILVTSGDPSDLISPQKLSDLSFRVDGKVFPERYENQILKPFFQIHESRYVMYWPHVDSAGLEQQIRAARERETDFLRLNSITADYIAAGEQQPESEHNFRGEWTWMGYSDDHYWRSSNRFLSYDIRNTSGKGKVLIVRLLPETKSEFTVSFNGKSIAEESIVAAKEPVVLTYELGDVRQDFTCRIETKQGSTISRLLDIRLCTQNP